MSGCNATLTTCTVTDTVVAVANVEPAAEGAVWIADVPDGTAVVRDGGRLMRLDVTTLTCDWDEEDCAGQVAHNNDVAGVSWLDSTRGATPHTPLCGEQSLYHTTCVKPAGHDGQHDDDPRTPPAEPFCYRCDDWGHTTREHDTPPADVCPDCDGEGWVCDDAMQTQCPPGSHRDCPSCGGTGDRPAVTDADWKHMALHALSDLRALGVPIEKIIGITPEVLDEVARYQREQEAYS